MLTVLVSSIHGEAYGPRSGSGDVCKSYFFAHGWCSVVLRSLNPNPRQTLESPLLSVVVNQGTNTLRGTETASFPPGRMLPCASVLSLPPSAIVTAPGHWQSQTVDVGNGIGRLALLLCMAPPRRTEDRVQKPQFPRSRVGWDLRV